MRTKQLASVAIFGLFLALTASASPNAVVESVQAPAWLERAEKRVPLVPGMQLENRDRVLTGAGARAVVQLADGSAIKLGEGVNVGVNAMRQESRGVFSAALDVAKGAFRLTTDIFRKVQSQRAINIRAGTVTIGIRGTDVWGRSNDEKDFVCLLEGRISATHPQGEPVELTEPLQFYGAEKGKAPGPVASVDRDQIAKWALETELQENTGVQRVDGRWALDFGRFGRLEALALYDQLAAAGFASRLKPVRIGGGYLYHVRLGQLVTEREARALAGRLARDLNLPAASIRRA